MKHVGSVSALDVQSTFACLEIPYDSRTDALNFLYKLDTQNKGYFT